MAQSTLHHFQIYFSLNVRYGYYHKSPHALKLIFSSGSRTCGFDKQMCLNLKIVKR